MKRYFGLLLFLTLLLDAANGSAQQWGAFGQWGADKCFDGIKLRIKQRARDQGGYDNIWEMQSMYSKPVHVYVIFLPPRDVDHDNYRRARIQPYGVSVTLMPGETKTSENTSWGYVHSTTQDPAIAFEVAGFSYDFNTPYPNVNEAIANTYEKPCEGSDRMPPTVVYAGS